MDNHVRTVLTNVVNSVQADNRDRVRAASALLLADALETLAAAIHENMMATIKSPE